jgi:5'-nucleotidase
VRRTCVALAVAAGVAAGVVGAPPPANAVPARVPVQVLAINDFHGRLAVPSPAESNLITGPGRDGVYGRTDAGIKDDDIVQVGGAVNLAATVRRLQDDFRHGAGGSAASFFVGAGDLIGDSPPESATYKDEPTIEMLNALGLDVSAVGNRELDRGTGELRRISAATDGEYTDDVTACQVATPGVDGCFGEGEHAFTGAQYTYLAANVVSRVTGEPILPPYQVLFTPEGMRVALIGVVFQKTPLHVPPEGITDVEFLDEAETVNRWVQEIRADGIESIGVLLHEGGRQTGPAGRDPNGCDQLAGSITEINAQIDPAVDFIVGGHTHFPFTCLLPSPDGTPRMVTEAGAWGQMVTDIRLTLDTATGDVDRAATYMAVNVPARRTSSPDARLKAIVDYWTAGPGNQPADGATAARGSTDAAASDSPGNDTRVRVAVAILAVSAVLAVVVAVLGYRRSLRRVPLPDRPSRWWLRP